MQSDKERLDAIARRIRRVVNELPDDGHKRPLNIVIEGDNYGNITLGNHITIHAPVDRQEQDCTLASGDTATPGQDGDR